MSQSSNSPSFMSKIVSWLLPTPEPQKPIGEIISELHLGDEVEIQMVDFSKVYPSGELPRRLCFEPQEVRENKVVGTITGKTELEPHHVPKVHKWILEVSRIVINKDGKRMKTTAFCDDEILSIAVLHHNEEWK